MIPKGTIFSLGLSQLVCWGITYYLIGVFGPLIAADLGWSGPLVYGGFSAALVVMALFSPLAGRMIDRYGGRRVMVAGSVLSAAGCAAIAASHTVFMYYAAWACLGLAMRFTLYEAAFASLVRIGGPDSRRAISLVTLLGGFASTVFWPVGQALAVRFGWREALIAYAVFALLTIPLHLAIPARRYGEAHPSSEAGHRSAPLARSERERRIAGGLYALLAMLANFLNSGMAAHMIAVLAGLGLAATVAVGVAALRGVGQSLARLAEILFGRRLHPLQLNLVATLILPCAFVAGLASGQLLAGAVAFAFLYGAGNGIVTITRGTLPLVLFGHRGYGALTGRLLVVSFVSSAVGPIAYAFVIERFGDRGALVLSVALALIMLSAAIWLKSKFPVHRPAD